MGKKKERRRAEERRTRKHGDAMRDHGEMRPTDPGISEYWGYGGVDYSGVSINENTIANISTVYACVSLISQTLASLPVGVFRKTKDEPTDDVTGGVTG